MSVEPKTESEWKSEGFTEEEIRAYSVIGLVLTDPPADAQFLRDFVEQHLMLLTPREQRRLRGIADKLEARG